MISLLLMMRFGTSLVDQFTFIISLAVLASLIPYIYSALAEIMLLIKSPTVLDRNDWRRALTLGCLGFGYAFWAVIGAGREVVFDGLLLFLSSLPVYLWFLGQHRKTLPKH
jgi:APA family basic amino acid/polyamine antiporter